MLRELHIVATCTDRKAVPPHPALRVRDISDLPSGTPDVREWLDRRDTTPSPTRAATSLYQGELWASTLRMAESARSVGRRVTLWIASAGYGLVSAESELKPYSATFSPGSPDSVSRGVSSAKVTSDGRAWWSALTRAPADLDRPASLADLARVTADAELLIVMSAAYLTACRDDLVEARSEHPRAVLISAGAADSRDHSGWAPPFDARVQGTDRPLRGARTSLNVRVAEHVLKELGGTELDPSTANSAVDGLMAGLDGPQTYDRQRATDAEVSAFVRGLLVEEPTASHTAALRRFRDVEQRACEQKRFARIFRQVKGRRSSSQERLEEAQR